MEAVIFLSIIIALFSILVSCFAIRRVKKQIAEITDALIDVKKRKMETDVFYLQQMNW